jgi:hypothetical protein
VLAGPQAATGSATVSGTIRYDDATPPLGAGEGSTGYADAITAVRVRLGGVDLHLDPAVLMANRLSSRVGYSGQPAMGFCPDVETCAIVGVPFQPTGNTLQVIDGTENSVLDETGVRGMGPTDVIAFFVGRTAAAGEFTPALDTGPVAQGGFEAVSVDGLGAGVFSHPTGLLIPDQSIPDFRALAGTGEIASSEFWLYLEGPGLAGVYKVEGTITRIEPLP